MALPLVKKSDRVRLVYAVVDPDVRLPPGEWESGWILADTPGVTLAPGATVVEVRALDPLEMFELPEWDIEAKERSLIAEWTAAARMGVVSVTGAEAGEELPPEALMSIGKVVLDLSRGRRLPFALVGTSPSDASPASGSGATPSRSTASRPAASKGARQPKGSTGRSATGRAARGSRSKARAS